MPANATPCTIRNCDKPATWQLTITGHPNSSGPLSNWYCHKHAVPSLWEESPVPYEIMLSGPHKNGRGDLAKGAPQPETETTTKGNDHEPA